MRRLGTIAVLAVCGYLAVWGISWLTGDRSVYVFGLDARAGFGRYPGVLFGGLPPDPGFDSDLPPFLAGVVGIVGLGTGLGVVVVRRLRHRP